MNISYACEISSTSHTPNIPLQYPDNPPTAFLSGQIKFPGNSNRMSVGVNNTHLYSDMTLACWNNIEIERKLYEQDGRMTGKHEFPPPGWIEHKGCEHCKTTERFLTFNKDKADARKADPETEYAFTLTMPPDYEPKKPIQEAARLIMEHARTSKPYEKAEKWAFVLEHTGKGTPHIHGVYKTPSGRRLEQRFFKRYWDLWDEKVKFGEGHKGGYHSKARHAESYRAYMEKEGEVFHSPAE